VPFIALVIDKTFSCCLAEFIDNFIVVTILIFFSLNTLQLHFIVLLVHAITKLKHGSTVTVSNSRFEKIV
jgi:hypothetical protein